MACGANCGTACSTDHSTSISPCGSQLPSGGLLKTRTMGDQQDCGVSMPLLQLAEKPQEPVCHILHRLAGTCNAKKKEISIC